MIESVTVISHSNEKLHRAWRIQSALEAFVISQMATYGKGPQTVELIISHQDKRDPNQPVQLPQLGYDNEVEFFNRDQIYGPLMADNSVVERALIGMWNISQTQSSHRDITPALARRVFDLAIRNFKLVGKDDPLITGDLLSVKTVNDMHVPPKLAL